jgi:hypothetical protein
LDDGGNSFGNYVNLIAGLSLNWYFRYDGERKHREIWRLERKSKEEERAREAAERAREADAKALLELLHLICPVVVLVRDKEIMQSAVFKDYFGVSVSNILDLPTVYEKGSPDVDLGGIVREAENGKLPTKRGITIRPFSGTTVFRCTVCAIFAESRKGVYLGFQIEEQWTTSAAEPDSSGGEEQVEAPERIPDGSCGRDDASVEGEAPRSVNENMYSSLEDYGLSFSRIKSSLSKRVSFEVTTDVVSQCSSNSGNQQNRRNFFELNKCLIDSSSLHIQNDESIGVAFRESLPVRASLHTVDVDLHPRGQGLTPPDASKAIHREVKTLLRCLHPNVLGPLGFLVVCLENKVLL